MAARRTKRAGKRYRSTSSEPTSTPFDRDPRPERRPKPERKKTGPRPLDGLTPHPDGGWTGICVGTSVRDGQPCLAEYWTDQSRQPFCSSCRISSKARRRREAETLQEAA